MVAASQTSPQYEQLALYINGALDLTATFSYDWNGSGITNIGAMHDLTYPFIGGLDDVRISRRVVYTGPFTPPERAFALM